MTYALRAHSDVPTTRAVTGLTRPDALDTSRPLLGCFEGFADFVRTKTAAIPGHGYLRVSLVGPTLELGQSAPSDLTSPLTSLDSRAIWSIAFDSLAASRTSRISSHSKL
jgi:hypothetical protein